MEPMLREELSQLVGTLQKFSDLDRSKAKESENYYIRGANAGAASAYDLARTWLIRIMEGYENE